MKEKKFPLRGKVLGILGGIGPEASATFYSMLVKKIQERGFISKNTDFPKILINSIPAPELFGEDSNEDKLYSYLEGIKELNLYNPSVIAIVCNTAHMFYDTFSKNSQAPIINLIKEVKNRLRNNEKYLLIGSTTTIQSKIYSFNGKHITTFTSSDMKEADKIIFNYNRGYKQEEQKRRLILLINKYLAKEPLTLIVGCTELALLLKNMPYKMIDTMDILSDAVIDNLRNVKFINNKTI
jgi:aspartate racemase